MTKQTYENAVNILLDAYNNETLFHGDCEYCAVGNILGTSKWNEDFTTCFGVQEVYYFFNNRDYFKHYYHSKGFTREELMKIEYAFERSIYDTPEGYYYYERENVKKGQYIGLCAVLKVMAEMVEDEEIEPQINQDRLNTIAQEKFCISIN